LTSALLWAYCAELYAEASFIWCVYRAMGPNKGGRLVYMKDPDGIRVELGQTTRKSDGTPV
jgi:hypothetical protein